MHEQGAAWKGLPNFPIITTRSHRTADVPTRPPLMILLFQRNGVLFSVENEGKVRRPVTLPMQEIPTRTRDPKRTPIPSWNPSMATKREQARLHRLPEQQGPGGGETGSTACDRVTVLYLSTYLASVISALQPKQRRTRPASQSWVQPTKADTAALLARLQRPDPP